MADEKVVLIRWIDSSQTYGWQDRPTEPPTEDKLTCITVGFLMAQDDVGITVAGSVGAGGVVSGVLTIPEVAIISQTVIQEEVASP